MRKSLLAGLVLLGLLSLSLWNLRALDSLTDELGGGIEASRQSWRDEDFDGAFDALRRTLELWQENRDYAHVFLRQPEVDAVSDAFYQLLGDVYARDARAAEADAQLLLHHLHSVDLMEHPGWGSVF